MLKKTKEKLQGSTKSWTIWFNTVSLALIPVFDYAQEQFSVLQPYLSDQTFKTLMLVILVGNIILRFKTTQGLGDKK